MQQGDVGGLVREAFTVIVKVGGPPLLASLVAGLAMSVLQAITQINEQTVAFVPKVALVAATILLTGGFMMATLGDFMRLMLDRLVAVGGS